MLNEINVETTDVGVFAINKKTGRSYHYFPFNLDTQDLLRYPTKCACGHYTFSSERFDTVNTVPDNVNPTCFKRAKDIAKREEGYEIEQMRVSLREIGKEIREIVDASISIAVLTCDFDLLDMMIHAYKQIDGARFALMSKDLGLKHHFKEIMIAKSNGNQDRVMELLEMAIEGKWLE